MFISLGKTNNVMHVKKTLSNKQKNDEQKLHDKKQILRQM